MPARVRFSNFSATEVSNTNSGAYTNGVSLTFTPNASKDYVVFWSCLGQLNSTSDSFQIQLFETSQRVFQTCESNEITTPIDYKPYNGMYKFSSGGSPSSMTFTLDIKREGAANTAKGKEFSIVALELGSNDVYAEALTRSTTTTTATKLTANITPGTTGDYYVVYSCEMDCTAAQICGVNAMVDGSSVLTSGQDLKAAKDTSDRMPWLRLFKKPSWSNAAHTAAIVINDAEPGTNTIGCTSARILILRASDFDNVYYAETLTDGTSTSTTYQDRVTLTQTTNAGDHLILGAGQVVAVSAATISALSDWTEDGTTFGGETQAETVSASDSDDAMHAVIQVRTLTNALHTWKFRAKAETTSLTVGSNGSIAVFELGASGAYSLTADAGVFTETGTVAGLLYGRLVAADSGTYVETGTDATLVYGHPMVASAGSYAVTGTDASLLYGRRLDTVAGSYVETGTAANLYYGYRLDASSGSFVETGTDAGLLYGHRLDTATIAYSITGTDASLLYGRLALGATAGSYTITGTDVTFVKGYGITGDAGSYVVTGTDVTFRQTYVVVASAGSYAITGTDANFIRGLRLDAQSGTYAETGTDAGLYRGYPITASAGSYTVTGTAANLYYGRSVVASTIAYTITGTDVTFRQTYVLAAGSGAYVFAGSDAALSSVNNKTMVAETGTYSVSGSDAGLLKSTTVAANTNSYSITGTDADLKYGRRLSADTGSIVIAGTDSSLLHTIIMAAGAGDWTVDGSTAGLFRGLRLSAESFSIVIEGFDAELIVPKSLIAESGEFTLTGSDVTFTRFNQTTPFPARVTRAPAEDRTVRVAAEDRTVRVAAEDRTIRVPPLDPSNAVEAA